MIYNNAPSSDPSNSQEKLSWDAIGFIVASLSMPHIFLLNAFFPLKLMEKSLWLALFVLAILAFSAHALLKLQNSKYFKSILLSSVMLVLVSVIRSDIYQLNVVMELVGSRSLVTIPLMLFASVYYLRDQRVAKALIWGIILTGFTQALIGVLHKYVFPEIVTGVFASAKGKLFYIDSLRGRAFYSRESGTFGNPSQYADMICLSACLFAWFKPKIDLIPRSLNYALYIAFAGILLLGLMPSLCRLPIIFTLIFLFLLFGEKIALKNWKFLLALGSLSFVLLVTFVYIKYPQLIERFITVGAYGRTQKNELLFNALVSDIQYFLVGIPNDFKTALRSVENLGFGDNSYLQLIASCGFPIVILWSINQYKIFNSALRIEMSLLKLTFLLFMIVNFYIGDTIYADGWNLFLFLTLVLFFGEEKALKQG